MLCLRGAAPFVTMVQAVEPGQGNDLGVTNGPGLLWTARGRGLGEAEVRAIGVVVSDVISKQVAIVEHDDVVGELAADAADPALGNTVSEGHAVADAAASFGVSRPTFYKAQTDFERDGLAGLMPGKRGPRGPHKLTGQVMDMIASMIAKEPELDAATLVERVEQKQGVRVHRRTIERALARLKKKRR